MNALTIIASCILWFYGSYVLIIDLWNWNHPKKRLRDKYSEIVYAIAFYIDGYIVLTLFDNESINDFMFNRLYTIMVVFFMAVLIWLWIFNVLYTYLRIQRKPDILRKNAIPTRNLELFLNQLEIKYQDNPKNDDIIKDLSRKLLHVVLLAFVIGLHYFALWYAPVTAQWGLSAIAFRNYLYVIAAFFFVIMFTTADSVRVYKFHLLPDWAIKWYAKSIEPKSEAYTYISSVPFLLTVLLFIHAPIQILFSVAWVSCISDAVASVVGKSYGKHKMTNFGRYPNKSFEGLLAGAFAAFIGVYLLFEWYPMNNVTGTLLQPILGLVVALVFVLIDAFSKYIVDNVENTLLPGMVLYTILWFFVF